jgi:tetratricopeptide (TPR) repeat protein
MGRVDAIREIVQKTPNDPFPRYGLAMELKNQGAREEAAAEFAELERRFPEYVAQYLMHGNLLVEMGRAADAKGVYARGMEAARKARNTHALGELEQALTSLSELE